MKRLTMICILSFVFIAMTASVSYAADTVDDYSAIISSLPALGEQATEFPSFIAFDGDPNYAGSFEGKQGNVQVNGYVQNGLIYGLTIQPLGNISADTASAVANILEEKYGRPSFSAPGAVYEWKYSRNGVRWYVQFACGAGIISGQRN